MSDEITLQQLLEVQAHFGLPSTALVEKDFHVVKALAAIAAVQTPPLQLVFGGGTALSRAHRLIGRMSEDIDLKIVADEEPSRRALRRLRDAMTDALLRAGFRFDPGNPAHRKSANESRYTIYRLPYEALSREGALRPEIQIEAAVWPLRRPAVTLSVSSFVAEGLKRPPEVASIGCVSITQRRKVSCCNLIWRPGPDSTVPRKSAKTLAHTPADTPGPEMRTSTGNCNEKLRQSGARGGAESVYWLRLRNPSLARPSPFEGERRSAR